jgi:GxxExxY protein
MTHTPDNDLTRRVIDCATEVHSHIGPGLDKDVYETCLAMELTKADLPFERGRVLTFVYNGHQLDYQCAADFIVAGSLLLQIEAVEEIEPIHEQRLRTCLYMGGFTFGLMLNFNVVDMDDGILGTSGTVAEEHPRVEELDVFDDPNLGATF